MLADLSHGRFAIYVGVAVSWNFKKGLEEKN
jgi:hypothetical protein